MQAIILAAGMGKRLGKYTKNNTKCMLPINGRTLAERALDALNETGIRKCVIVVGYKKDNVMAALGTRYKNVEIVYVANDVYDKTNNIYSLYLAKDFLLQDDTLLLESDLIFESCLIADMLNCSETTVAAVAKHESWMDGTVVQLTENNVIATFIPKRKFNYNKKETYYKTVNIYKFSRSFLRDTYVPFLEAYSRAMGNNEYYEQVLRVITTLDTHELKAFVLTDQKWYEIDDVADKEIAETIFSKTSADRLKRIQRNYGGYWRYPALLDFCYLVNPYFPTAQMQNEMKSYFNDLLANYPSGLNTQNLLAAKLYNLDEDSILVGNGAAELIRALAPAFKDYSVGVIYPTFNEYPESFEQFGIKIVPFVPKNFAYNKGALIEFSAQCNTLLLINPDNPSGYYIPSTDVISLVEYLKKQGKRLILDESFADFADAENEPSFLRQSILDKYSNMLVLKSLSKSYGVPGIRLGVLASGDKALIAQIRKNLSIWNINSFGEYFLQIIGKYQKDYRIACKKIAAERARFKTRLEETGAFMVYPSQANYFLCRLKSKGIFRTAAALAEHLLDRHKIFIKDLTGKKGIPDTSYIRLAVRNETDNDALVAVLELRRPLAKASPTSKLSI